MLLVRDALTATLPKLQVLPGDSVSGLVTEDSEAVDCGISRCSLVMHFLPHEALLFSLTGS